METNNRKRHTTEKSEPSFFKSLLIDIIIAILLAGVVLFFIRPTVVKQSSMENTLIEDDYVIMYKRAYAGDKTPQRGDIVIFRDPEEDRLLIKRVIGLPGDEIRIEDEQLYLNGEAYEEDYLKDGVTPSCDVPEEGGSVTVPADRYYCMGDNRVVSIDSRYASIGFVSEEQIAGKAVLRLWPLSKISTF